MVSGVVPLKINTQQMPKRTVETPLTYTNKDGIIYSELEEGFCQGYVLNKGNGTQAMFDTGNFTTRNSAGVVANEYLRKPKILARINELVDKHVMTEEEADFELGKVIRQEAELPAKTKGLEIYNKLKGRYLEHNKQKAPNLTINADKVELINGAFEDM